MISIRNFAAGALICIAGASQAASLTWTDWTSSTGSAASGTLGTTGVSFSGQTDPAAQTDGSGINYWANNNTLYTPTGAENGPGDSDIIRLKGGVNAGTQTITFSKAIVNPLMAILSMGQLGLTVNYNFDAKFDVLRNGFGYWGGGTLTELAGNVLEGKEGHGLIQFQGTFTSISWTIPVAEDWHGFQVGYVDADQMAPVPLPAAGWLMIAALGSMGAAARRRKA